MSAVVRSMIECLGTLGRAATVGALGPGMLVKVDIMDLLTFGKKYVGCCKGDSLPAKVCFFVSFFSLWVFGC